LFELKVALHNVTRAQFMEKVDLGNDNFEIHLCFFSNVFATSRLDLCMLLQHQEIFQEKSRPGLDKKMNEKLLDYQEVRN